MSGVSGVAQGVMASWGLDQVSTNGQSNPLDPNNGQAVLNIRVNTDDPVDAELRAKALNGDEFAQAEVERIQGSWQPVTLYFGPPIKTGQNVGGGNVATQSLNRIPPAIRG